MATAISHKNVVIVGGSYVGLATANELINALPTDQGYRVLVVEKNSHFGHLFAYPRFALTSAQNSTHKAFIPYTTFLPSPHQVVRAKALSISPTTISLDRYSDLADGKELPYEALVMATGTALTPPGTLPGESKAEGIAWFTEHQAEVEKATNIVIVGGGAVGVQMASDIPVLFPGKKVTLVHSRPNLMPRFHVDLHSLVQKRLTDLGVTTVLGSRAKIPAGGWGSIRSGGTVETEDGQRIGGDLIIFATGQTPLSAPLRTLAPSAIQPSGFIRVKPTFQIDGQEPSLEKVFAVGDIADSGAPKAARPGAVQAGVVARNIASLLAGSSQPLETYSPDPAAIHLTLGIVESVIFRNPRDGSGAAPTVTWKHDGVEDMGIEGVWKRRAPGVTDHHL